MRKPHSTYLGVQMALGFNPDHARFLLCRVPSVLQYQASNHLCLEHITLISAGSRLGRGSG